MASLYRTMVSLRHLERRLTDLSQQGVLRGSLHLATGQEALPAGTCASLQPDDYMTVTYRGHGYILAKGCDPRQVVAEILGRKGGLCKGKGGKMHLTDLPNGLLGANGIVAAGIPVAVGAAMSAQIDGKDRISVAVFGDGALNQGVAHESLNMAGLWKLPVLFLCENNLYAEMTPLTESAAVTKLSNRVSGYGIKSIEVDGNDVLAVREAVKLARRHVASGKGPVFIEAMTYRTCGHYQNDPGTAYRTKEEVDAWIRQSPIVRFEEHLRKNGFAGGDIDAITREAEEAMEAAIAWALESPEPSEGDLTEDLFV